VEKLAWHAIDTSNHYDAMVVRSILQREQPDVVHGHNLKGMSYTLPGVCTDLGIPYIHTLHNYQLLHPFGTFTIYETPPYFRPKLAAKIYQAWNRKKFKNVTGVITPTTFPLQLHQKVGFFLQARTVCIPSPVHTKPATHNFMPKLRLVYFGAIEEIKGIRSLLLAAQHLPKDGWSLDIFGRGTLEKEMRILSQGDERIHWMEYAADASVLSKYDALVYPSTCWETQGVSMAEALIQGTPVIASNIGSIPETIQDKQNGFLYPSGNVAALTSLLTQCIDRPERLTMLRDEAKESSSRFSPDIYLTKLQEFYRSCLSK
jgi:glycosyltransferase involved in cell wall biosynthesis